MIFWLTIKAFYPKVGQFWARKNGAAEWNGDGNAGGLWRMGRGGWE